MAITTNTFIPRLITGDFKVLRDVVTELVSNNRYVDAYTLARALDIELARSSLESTNSQYYKNFEQLIAQCKWVALPLLTNSETLWLFAGHIAQMWQIPDFDLQSKLHAKLISILVYEERDKFKQAIRGALEENREQIVVDKSVRPSLIVGDIIKDYVKNFGASLVGKLEQEQYIASANLLRGIPTAVRVKIRQLLNLYEHCKLSSLTLKGLEEGIPIGEPEQGIVREGIFERYNFKDIERDVVNAGKIIEQNLVRTGKTLDESQSKAELTKVSPQILSIGSSVSGELISSQPRPQWFKTVQPALVESAVVDQGVGREGGAAPVPTMPLRPSVAVLKTAEPAFLFDEADEREADRYRERMANGEWRMAKNLESRLRELTEEVVKEHNFSFKDEVSHKRFVQLFVSFLKDVRDVIEAREMLLKSTESGGLGLTSDKAEKVIEILQQTKQQIANGKWRMAEDGEILKQARPVEKRSLFFGVQDDKKEQADIIPKPKTELDKMIEADRFRISNDEFLISKKNLEIGKPEIAPPRSTSGSAMTRGPEPKITPPTPPDAAKAEALRQQILEQIVSKIEADKTAPLPPPEPLARPRLVDVKAPPRVLGPLEELRTLSVVDFRRLSDNPTEALNKINKKIDIVGEASVGKRVEAVRAWQVSPVYQLYLKIGRASIETGQSVADIIAGHMQKNETTLSEDEFNAVADFNERIRF